MLENLLFSLTVIIQKPIGSDAGQYKCNIKNEAGEINANLTLNFETADDQKAEKSAPTIIEKPKIVPAPDASKVYMECRVKAKPAPKVFFCIQSIYF